MNEIKYIASVRTKEGRIQFSSQAHPTREAAAAECWERYPTRVVTTSRASFYNGAWLDCGSDIHWLEPSR